MKDRKPGGYPASQSDRPGADLGLDATVAPDGDIAVNDMPHPRGPDEHKQALKTLGLRNVDDLLVVHRNHDPFFKGSPAHRRDGEWFAELWQRLQCTDGFHLRRIHYQIVTSDLAIRLPDGKLYRNNRYSAGVLAKAASAARILRLVDPEAFVDRQGAPPLLNTRPREEMPEPFAEWRAYGEYLGPRYWSLPKIPVYALSSDFSLGGAVAVGGYGYDFADQPVLLELWVEKSTMRDILLPVCSQLGINYVQGKGFESITAAIELLRRVEAHGKPAHVMYVSDFDTQGRAMPGAVARQVEFWRTELDIDVEVTVEALVLTPEQIKRYELPHNPEKPGDVELDALEAKHKGELARLVRRVAQQWMDVDLPERMAAVQQAARAGAAAQWENATADLYAELTQFTDDVTPVADRYRKRLTALAEELAADMEPFQTRLEQLRAEANARFDEIEDYGLPDRPAAYAPDVDRDRLLFDARRHWLDQLAAYRAHKGGGS